METIIIILLVLAISLICLSVFQNRALIRFKKNIKELEEYNKCYHRAYKRAMRQTSILLKNKKKQTI